MRNSIFHIWAVIAKLRDVTVKLRGRAGVITQRFGKIGVVYRRNGGYPAPFVIGIGRFAQVSVLLGVACGRAFCSYCTGIRRIASTEALEVAGIRANA